MANKRGFTLVEMMVATTLVVVMMLMFAMIFQTAGGLVHKQKGMAELDQSVRTLTILLRGDMNSRTFRDVVPFYPGQETDGKVGAGYAPSRRRGFFSISENGHRIQTDDVLHLTITSANEGGEPALPYSARATLLFNGSTPADRDQYLIDNPDQPEFDDGQLQENRTGSSRHAEVCWFVRNGTLYRRSLLIRDPYNRGANLNEEEPTDNSGIDFIAATYAGEDHLDSTNPTGVFWRDFDYSAYADPSGNLKFHSVPDAIDNKSNSPAVIAGFPRSLGIPFLRYGNSISRATAGTPAIIQGAREYLGSNPTSFIGRFTKEEATHRDFSYPGNYDPTTDPHTRSDLTLNEGDVNQYRYGSDPHQSRGEDIVMSGVHEFNIQVWDEIIGGFVNLGHSQTGTVLDVSGQPVPNVPGWYNASRNRNSNYGNTFDTWHPYEDMPEPPYAPFGDPSDSPNDERADRLAEDNLGLGVGGESPGEIPLRAIRIHIRFFDEGSDQMRDLTFTFPLIEKAKK